MDNGRFYEDVVVGRVVVRGNCEILRVIRHIYPAHVGTALDYPSWEL
jgi:hypothetical protein